MFSNDNEFLYVLTCLFYNFTRRLSQNFFRNDLASVQEAKVRLEAESAERVAEGESRVRSLNNELETSVRLIDEKNSSLKVLDAVKKSLCLPVSEALIARQLDALRKEHSGALAALSNKSSDEQRAADKQARAEAYGKSCDHELQALRQELATCTERANVLSDKARKLETDAFEKRQLNQEVEQLRAQVSGKDGELNRAKTQLDELAARLYSKYEALPTEAVEAWLEPIQRERREALSLVEVHRAQAQRAANEVQNAAVATAHLEARLSASHEGEKKLQAKVVEQTMLLERLTKGRAVADAAMAAGGGGGGAVLDLE